MRTIVTGGAGFIGSHLADALATRGDEVHVLDNLSTGSREHVGEGVVLHKGDIRSDAAALFDEVRPDECFHLAAQADVPTSLERPDYDADVNVLGTVRVLEAARRHGTPVVFSSTGGAIYGECARPAREDDPRQPLSPYGVSKLAGEEYLAGWNRLHGTRHVALRFANVYGPRQSASLEGGVVAIFLERMAAGQETVIYGDGGQARDFVHVADVVRGLLAAQGSGRGGGVFNLGSGRAVTVSELHALCRKVSGSPDEPRHGQARPGDVRRSVLDPTAAHSELGWELQLDLEAGLRDTWSWMQGTAG